MILLVDPFAILAVQSQYEGQLAQHRAAVKPSLLPIGDVIDRLLLTLEGEFGLSKTGRVKQPLAIVLNKADAFDLEQLIGETAVDHALAKLPPAGRVGRDAVRDTVLKDQLVEWGEQGFVSRVEARFGNVRYFACSALGRMPDRSGTRFTPRAVLPPLQWIFEQSCGAARRRTRWWIAAAAVTAFTATAITAGWFWMIQSHPQSPSQRSQEEPGLHDVDSQTAALKSLQPAPAAAAIPTSALRVARAGAERMAAPLPGAANPVAPSAVMVIDLEQVVVANQPSVLAALEVARNGQRADIEAAARAAARAFDFHARQATVIRDRKSARLLNKEALDRFGSEIVPRQAAELVVAQKRAFAADPLDVEVASNLAIYLFRAGDPVQAYKYAIYAMSLPRDADSGGRTADWNTLAAAFASRADLEHARLALYVTLALSTNVQKRCDSAIDSVRRTYGAVLRPATEAMFARIRERGMSDAPTCSTPIIW